MISCLGTSIVTTRKSIFTMRSTMGMRKIIPGPLAPCACSLPRRKMTPRSYSRRMRSAWGRMKAAMIISTTAVVPSLKSAAMSCSIISPLLGFGFHFQRQTFDGHDLHRLIFLDRRVANRLPEFALDEHIPAARINARQRRHDLAEHRLAAHAHGQPLRAQTGAYHEQEEQRR